MLHKLMFCLHEGKIHASAGRPAQESKRAEVVWILYTGVNFTYLKCCHQAYMFFQKLGMLLDLHMLRRVYIRHVKKRSTYPVVCLALITQVLYQGN